METKSGEAKALQAADFQAPDGTATVENRLSRYTRMDG
jgi:hypothetical protein